jgi:hypothetical protein
MPIKYTNLFHCKPLKNTQNGIFVLKYTIWQPCGGVEVNQFGEIERLALKTCETKP